jgi:hypothetical protein
MSRTTTKMMILSAPITLLPMRCATEELERVSKKRRLSFDENKSTTTTTTTRASLFSLDQMFQNLQEEQEAFPCISWEDFQDNDSASCTSQASSSSLSYTSSSVSSSSSNGGSSSSLSGKKRRGGMVRSKALFTLNRVSCCSS